MVFFYKERQVRGLSSRRLTWRRLLEKVIQAGSKRLDRLFLCLCPRFSTAAVSNVAQLLISSQHLSSLSSSVWHPHTGGKTVSSVCLSPRKVVSRQKRRWQWRRWRRRQRQRRGRRTPQGNFGVTTHHTWRCGCPEIIQPVCFWFNKLRKLKTTWMNYSLSGGGRGGGALWNCVFVPIILLISVPNSQHAKMIKIPSTAAKLAACWDGSSDAVPEDEVEPRRVTRLAGGYLGFLVSTGSIKKKLKGKAALKISFGCWEYLKRNILKVPYNPPLPHLCFSSWTPGESCIIWNLQIRRLEHQIKQFVL